MSSVSIATKHSKKYNFVMDKNHSRGVCYSTGYLMLFLWQLGAIISAANTEISSTATGVSVAFKMQDILTAFITTAFLIKGLNHSNPYFIFPWIIVSSWNMYNFQFPSLLKIYYDIQRVIVVSRLAWLALGIAAFSVFLKALLIGRILHLSINVWYQNKVKSETHNF